jgi:hypothetical protein
MLAAKNIKMIAVFTVAKDAFYVYQVNIQQTTLIANIARIRKFASTKLSQPRRCAIRIRLA